ncbi:MAG: hypothetical protein ACI4NO_02455 [Oxalobacter sp.]
MARLKNLKKTRLSVPTPFFLMADGVFLARNGINAVDIIGFIP